VSRTVAYRVEGMTCEHCVRAVTEALAAMPGVEDVAVDLDRGTAAVGGTDVAESAVGAALEEAGYTLA